MKKNLPLILIVIALLGVLGYLKYKQNQSNFSDAEFKIDNVEDIYSIEISDKYGNKTLLKKLKTKWMVNDSLPAQHSKMVTILETLHKLQVELPVADSLRTVAIEDLRKFSTQVTLKDKDGDEIKTIFVGNNSLGGNFMILSHNGVVSNEPYVVKIPGTKVDIKYRFLAKPDMWYSTEVFATNIDKVKEIRVNFHETPQYSFVLSKDEELIQINPLVDSIKINRQLNRDNVLQFLLEFEQKHFEGRIGDDSTIRLIKTMKPYATIDLTDVFDKKFSIILYRKYLGFSLPKNLFFF